jgi:hypothetical protein
MPCSLKSTGIGAYSAPTGANITLQFNSTNGSQMTDLQVEDSAGTITDYVPAGNTVVFPVPQGQNTVSVTFALSGAHESAALVESCGSATPATHTLAMIHTWNSSGLIHMFSVNGLIAAAAAQAGGQV